MAKRGGKVVAREPPPNGVAVLVCFSEDEAPGLRNVDGDFQGLLKRTGDGLDVPG